MRRFLASIPFLRLSLAVCAVLLLANSAAHITSAQSGCTAPNGRPSWPRGSTVYVTVDSSMSETQRTQVALALSGWSGANNGSNSSGVTFQIGPPAYDGAPTLLITNGTVYNNPTGTGYNTGSGTVATDVGALTQRNSNDATGQLSNATITFNTNGAQASPGCPACGPLYDPSLPGYDTFFLKILLHELGHTMGLGEASGTPGGSQTPQNSVMNQLTGGCPNDNCTVNGTQGGNLPTYVTDCDNTSVSSVLTYAYLADNGGGGVGGGDGGGGGYYYYPCTPYYWVYYESWDGGETWEMVDYWYAGCW